MKSGFFSFYKLLLIAALALAGCSSQVYHPIVSADSPVSRDKTLIVMGVSFWEQYNDTEDLVTKKLYSADLLSDTKRVSKRLENPNGTLLTRPLHYLSRFQFQFVTPKEADYTIVRFDKDTREYEDIAIHEFVPGPVQLVNIATVQQHYTEDTPHKSTDYRWKRHWVDYSESFGAWDLPAGKVAYTGHLTMYFKTERFIFGMLTPEELVKEIKLVAVVIEDRFDAVREQLKKEKPWFPVNEMENLSKPGRWIYDEEAFDEFHRVPDAQKKDPGKKKPKRDSSKYFF